MAVFFFRRQGDFPVAHPCHERRKYLLREGGEGVGDGPAASPDFCAARDGQRFFLLKFAGLGGYGQRTLARAQRNSEAGFGPRVVGLADGFLVTEFAGGVPMCAGRITPAFLKAAARYLAFLFQQPADGYFDPAESILEMILINTEEGLGDRWAKRLRASRLSAGLSNEPRGTVDGRMLLHEWIELDGGGWLKADGVDHCADHFFPGCMDTAWDVAGCLVEWNLSPGMGDCLLSEYGRLSGDRSLERRLPFYRVAYLAHRLGYASMAADTQGEGSADGQRFRQMVRLYARQLRHEIARL